MLATAVFLFVHATVCCVVRCAFTCVVINPKGFHQKKKVLKSRERPARTWASPGQSQKTWAWEQPGWPHNGQRALRAWPPVAGLISLLHHSLSLSRVLDSEMSLKSGLGEAPTNPKLETSCLVGQDAEVSDLPPRIERGVATDARVYYCVGCSACMLFAQ